MNEFPEIISAREVDRERKVTWAQDLFVARPGSSVPQEAVERLRDLRAYTNSAPLSSRLPFSYHRVPPKARLVLGRVIGWLKVFQQERWGRFPIWPLDLSVDFWSDFHGLPSIQLCPTPVVLSHDLDSPIGLQHFLSMFSLLERKYGAHSVNFVVPCGWDIDLTLLDQIAEAGHEIGIHGYDHSNKTPFLSRAQQRQRLSAPKTLIERYSIKGYRAPSLLRTPSLVDGLSDLYDYDATFPTSGGLFPTPNNGIATARPYLVRPGLWEFPLTLPRDGSLLFLGMSPREILQLWIRSAEQISRSGGIVVLLTHCESGFSGQPSMLQIYEEFLSYIVSKANFSFQTFEALFDKVMLQSET